MDKLNLKNAGRKLINFGLQITICFFLSVTCIGYTILVVYYLDIGFWVLEFITLKIKVLARYKCYSYSTYVNVNI